MRNMREAGEASNLVRSSGPYSASVRIGNLVAISGQCGYAKDGVLAEGIEAQLDYTFQNVSDALAASGCTMDDVLRVDVFLISTDDVKIMNEKYADAFTTPYPARTTVYVGLREGVLVEVTVLAVVPDRSVGENN